MEPYCIIVDRFVMEMRRGSATRWFLPPPLALDLPHRRCSVRGMVWRGWAAPGCALPAVWFLLAAGLTAAMGELEALGRPERGFGFDESPYQMAKAP